VKELLAAGGYSTVKTLSSGIIGPRGVAVDGAETSSSPIRKRCVKEILAAGGYTSVKTLDSGFNNPAGVAVDGSGNVFVADWGHNAVKEILAAGGYTSVNTLPSGFSGPYGVAVDRGRNVFVADSGNNRVVKLGTASVDFGTAAIGQTGAMIPLTFTFESGGIIGSPVALTQGAAGLDFAAATTGTCKAGTNYSAGATCTVNVTFTPKSRPGPRYGAAASRMAPETPSPLATLRHRFGTAGQLPARRRSHVCIHWTELPLGAFGGCSRQRLYRRFRQSTGC